MTEIERKTIDETCDGGRTGMRHWVLIGPEGAVQVSFMKLPEIAGYRRAEEMYPGGWTGVDLGYHSLKPLFDDQQTRLLCDYVQSDLCYYAGSAIPAQQIVTEWAQANYDDDVIWRAAELAYRARFIDDLPGEPAFEEKARALGLLLGCALDDADEDRKEAGQ